MMDIIVIFSLICYNHIKIIGGTNMAKEKSFTYQLSDSDVKTILTTLLVMDEVLFEIDIPGLDESTKLRCSIFGKKASESLLDFSKQISFNELSSIHISLQIANMINHGDILVDNYSKNLCSQFVFSINKLLPVFDSFFS